jgi:glutaredoxin-like YruB-family protein
MKNITIYSTPTCPYCILVKNYLDQKGIEYDYIDVSEDQEKAQEMIKKSGQEGVPVVDIDGEIIIGFDKVAIDKALNSSE